MNIVEFSRYPHAPLHLFQYCFIFCSGHAHKARLQFCSNFVSLAVKYYCDCGLKLPSIFLPTGGKEKIKGGKKEGAYSQNKITCQLSIIIRMAYYRNNVSFSSCVSVEIYLLAHYMHKLRQGENVETAEECYMISIKKRKV